MSQAVLAKLMNALALTNKKIPNWDYILNYMKISDNKTALLCGF